MNFYDSLKKYGCALIVSGPSGAGKSTLLKNILQMHNNLEFSVSCTTRKPREGEIHGQSYYFLTEKEFKEKIKKNEFLEYAKVHDNFYGTLISEVSGKIRNGKNIIIEIDIQGMRLIRAAADLDNLLAKLTTYIFITPPCFDELENRLRKRGTEEKRSLENRLKNAKNEIAAWREYKYLVVNDDVNQATEDLLTIINAATMKSSLLAED